MEAAGGMSGSKRNHEDLKCAPGDDGDWADLAYDNLYY